MNAEPQGWLAFALVGKSVLVFAWLAAVILGDLVPAIQDFLLLLP